MCHRWLEAGQLRTSLYWSWIVISLPMLAAVLLPLAAPVSWIDRITPRCLWKVRLGLECPGCGLTTAFLHIARAEWREASAANRAGIPLYASFAVNSLIWVRSLLIALLPR